MWNIITFGLLIIAVAGIAGILLCMFSIKRYHDDIEQ